MKSRLNKEIGKRIRYLRKQRGLSQEKLAECLNIATTSLSYIETGRGFMTLATLENMSRILQVEPYEIFKFSSVQTNEEMYEKIITKLNLIKKFLKLVLTLDFLVLIKLTVPMVVFFVQNLEVVILLEISSTIWLLSLMKLEI